MAEVFIISQTEFSRYAWVTPTAIYYATGRSLGPAMIGKKINAWHPAAITYLNNQAKKYGKTVQIPMPEEREAQPDSSPKQKQRRKVEAARTARKKKNRPKPKPKSKPKSKSKVSRPKKKVSPVPLESDVRETALQAPSDLKHQVQAEPEPNDDFIPKKGMDSLPEDIRKLADMTLRELVKIFGTDELFLSWLKATKEIENIHEKRLKNMKMEGTLVLRKLVRKGVLDLVDSAHKKLLTDGAQTLSHKIHTMSQSGRSVEDCEKYVSNYLEGFIKPMKRNVKRNLKNG